MRSDRAPGELYELQLLGPDDTAPADSPRPLGNSGPAPPGARGSITARVVGDGISARAVLFDPATGQDEDLSVSVRSVGTGLVEELHLRPLPVPVGADMAVQVCVVTAAASDAILGVTATLRARQHGELAS